MKRFIHLCFCALWVELESGRLVLPMFLVKAIIKGALLGYGWQRILCPVCRVKHNANQTD